MINKTLSRFATHDNSAYPQLWRGCVGAWCPSLGPSGSRLHDYSRPMNWGTLTNMDLAAGWVVNSGAYAIDLDGTDDRVDCSGITSRLQTHTRGAVSVWFNLDVISTTNMIFSVNATAATGLSTVALYINGDAGLNKVWMFAYLNNGGSYNNPADNSVITAGQWYHVLFCQDGGGPFIYFNGVRRATNAGPLPGTQTSGAWFSLLTNAADVSIGDYVSNSTRAGRWNGKIDDVRIYDRVPSAEEARLLSRRRGIAFTPRTRRLAVPEQGAVAGVAKPVLFHSHYMSQGMRP
jgi:hypothetical protein